MLLYLACHKVWMGDIVMIDAIGVTCMESFDEENLGERSDVTQTASKSGH